MVTRTQGINWDELIQPGRVNGRIYYDEEIFQEELQRIFYREWIFVGHESEVPEPGDYVTRQIGLEPVIMTRDERGQIHLLLNRCVHRGATVCQVPSGNANAFRCAYHGWTYRNTGELIGVPFDRAYPLSFKIDHPSLITVPRVDSYRGFVFGNMSPEGISLYDFLGGAREGIIDRICNLSPEGEIEIRSEWTRDRAQCNWKVAMDNHWGAGADHGPFTHRSVPRRNTRLERGTVSGFVQAGINEPTAASELGEFELLKGHDLDNGHMWDVTPAGGGDFGTGVKGWINVDNPRPAEKRYVQQMMEAYGEERARKLLHDGPPHAPLWPNLFFPSAILTLHVPLSATETMDMYNFPFLKGAPEEFNQRLFRRAEGSYSPAGMIITDDLEMWQRIQRALVAKRGEEWIDMTKGLEEEIEREWFERGGVIVVDERGHHNEFGLRHIHRHYKRIMTRP